MIIITREQWSASGDLTNKSIKLREIDIIKHQSLIHAPAGRTTLKLIAFSYC